MGVFGNGGYGGEAIDVAGHAEVEVEGLLVVGNEKKIFAVAQTLSIPLTVWIILILPLI